jgi:hypothetical protein
VTDLKQFAKQRGLRGYSRLRKAELIDFLNRMSAVTVSRNPLDEDIPYISVPTSTPANAQSATP